MSEWKEVVLGEIADIQVGFAFKSRDFSENPSDILLLRGVNIGQGFLDWSNSAYWPASEAVDGRYELQVGDVVLAMDRPWIEAGLKRARLRSADVPSLLVQRVSRLRGKGGVATSFIHHVAATEAFSRYLQSVVTGTTVPHISQRQIEAFPVRLPPFEVQSRICGVLDSVDDLIENNRRRIELLESMARAIYREWFVHFRFPGHEDVPMVDSDLGPIPAGWDYRQLQEVAQVNAKSRKPRPDESIRYLDISALGDREVKELSVFEGQEAPGRARRVLAPGDSVWAMVRPNRRAHALVVEPGTDWIASTGMAVLSPVAVPSSFLFETVSTTTFSDYLVSRTSGAAYPAVKPKDFESAPVLVPPRPELEAFDGVVKQMHEQSWMLRSYSMSLAVMRDLLLPKLVSGEIDVSELDMSS